MAPTVTVNDLLDGHVAADRAALVGRVRGGRGDGAVARAPRSDRAKRRQIPAELVALIEGWALRRPPPRVTEVHREAVRVAPERAALFWKMLVCGW
jgi:hypothetical protein